MISLNSGLRVYRAIGVTDMRKSIDTLAIVVADRLALDPLSGHLFALCNRRRDTIKILYWDRNGFCLWQKRLERHVFRWPTREAEVLTIDSRQLAWLLDGLDPLAVKGHSRLEYSTIF